MATELTERTVIEKAALEHNWVIDRVGLATLFTQDDRQFALSWSADDGRVRAVDPRPWMPAPTSYLVEWILEILRADPAEAPA
ncbi:hypothetical protein AB0M22_09360 [Nocardia sp. NPDC051756]|uniref:hypothetical protein n=1 Tax=Nocardia sp. NPDC051756 TaxID=3154751 RepID=UPI003430A897